MKYEEPVNVKDLIIINVCRRNNYCVVTSASNADWSLVVDQVVTGPAWSWGRRLDTMRTSFALPTEVVKGHQVLLRETYQVRSFSLYVCFGAKIQHYGVLSIFMHSYIVNFANVMGLIIGFIHSHPDSREVSLIELLTLS